MKRSERVRLYPTPHQVERLRFSLDVTRQLYNALLQQRRDAYRRGVVVSSKEQYKELTALRKDDARIAAVYRECQDAVLHRLDLAYAAFFRRIKAGETPGFPRFKPAVRWLQLEFPHGNRALRLDPHQRRVTVPGIGAVRLRKGRAVPAFSRAWIVCKNARWYACFECERGSTPLPKTGRTIGIDRGVHVLAATSEGRLIDNRAYGERDRERIARHQRALEARTMRDATGRVRNATDPRRQAATLCLARAKEREANRRRDYLHKVAREIVNRADVIGLEALHVRAMTRSAKGTLEQPGRNVRAKSALTRRLLDAGFGQFERLIGEKANGLVNTRGLSQYTRRLHPRTAENHH